LLNQRWLLVSDDDNDGDDDDDDDGDDDDNNNNNNRMWWNVKTKMLPAVTVATGTILKTFRKYPRKITGKH
jgi:hypothetical protein